MEEPLSKEIQSFFLYIYSILCSQGWGRSGLRMVLVYIEFHIHNGFIRDIHGAQGSGSKQSLREGPVVQVGVYYIFCWKVLRGRRFE